MIGRVVLDISRLIFDAGRPTPTGILRVELAYAEHLRAVMPERVGFAARNLFGRMGVVSRRQAARLIAETARLWRGDSVLPLPSLLLRCFFVWIHLTLLWRSEWRLRRNLRQSAKPAVYVIVSHANLDRPRAVRRLKNQTGMRLICFIHDVIPVQFPEFETQGWDRRCARRLRSAVELADAIVVNSQDTSRALCKEIGEGRAVPPVAVIPLGIATPLPVMPVPMRGGSPYFVSIGTIEPKKNHLLLLNVWRRLRDDLGEDTPRLIIIGRRGWENENVIDMLERSRSLAGVVEERGRLSDRDVAATLAGALALLQPSFVEGYGLPLAEALAAGVPVICSDIPAFREVGADVPEFLDPLDGPSWRNAIIDYAREGSPRRQAQLDRLKHWVAPRWEQHFRRVDELIAALGE